MVNKAREFTLDMSSAASSVRLVSIRARETTACQDPAIESAPLTTVRSSVHHRDDLYPCTLLKASFRECQRSRVFSPDDFVPTAVRQRAKMRHKHSGVGRRFKTAGLVAQLHFRFSRLTFVATLGWRGLGKRRLVSKRASP